jgi:hypothetical protein
MTSIRDFKVVVPTDCTLAQVEAKKRPGWAHCFKTHTTIAG